MSRVLLHIGYHKTGTTWLQRGLFSSEPFVQPFTSTVIRDAIVGPTEFQFDPVSAAANLAPRSGSVTVISDERLSGSPHAGGYDAPQTARRLVATFSEAQVLIVFREQRSAIHAVFQQYVRDGGAAPLKKYLRPRASYEIPQFRLEHFEYDHLIRLYRDLFSSSRVLALPYEHLVRDPSEFARRICTFVGVDSPGIDPSPQYEGWSSLAIGYKRQFNRLFVRNALNPSAPLYVKDHESRTARIDHLVPWRLSERFRTKERREISRFVGDHFRESNCELETLLGVDLGSLGYVIS